MPIPNFDHNDVLPPHLGDPRKRDELTPFPATSEEVCLRFGTSAERTAILTGWLGFRKELTALGITDGFQWLDGSFLENIEASEGRPPNDLDVVTFFVSPVGIDPKDLRDLQIKIVATLPEFFDRTASKARFKLDHFPIHLGAPGPALVENTRYWAGLFSHNRNNVWKGMLRIELNTPVSDTTAWKLLTATP